MKESLACNPRVFLAAPFGNYVQDDSFQPDKKCVITRYHNRLSMLGASVFSSHVNEDWGAAGLPPEDCMRDDLRALLAADCLCALIDDQPSAGVAFELGFAASTRRPTVLVTSTFARQSSMIRGMGTLLDLKVVEGDLASPAVIEKACSAAVDLGAQNGRADMFWDSPEVERALKFRSWSGAL